MEYAPGRHFALSAGRLFDPAAKEAVIGSFAARKLGLAVGDTFHPFHGLVYDARNQHPDTYLVTGILAPPTRPRTRWSGSRSTACRR